MNKILVPTDLSDLSEKALKLAVKVASKSKGHIDLVHFYKHPYGKTFSATGEMKSKSSDGDNIFTLKLLKKNLQQLKQMSDRNSTQDVTINYEIFDEDFDDGVEAFIKNENINLVVLSTTGEETATEFFTGNHAQQVIEQAPCPVLTVRENDLSGDFSNLVLGVDFDKDGKDNYLKAVSFINEFSVSLDSKIHLVHIAEEENQMANDKKKLEQFAKDHNMKNYTPVVIRDSNDLRGLISYGHKINAGAVAVLTHADGGLFRAFETNLSEELNKQADLPVLTVNLHRV